MSEHPDWDHSDPNVLEDLRAEAGNLGHLANLIDEETRNGRHPAPAVQRHLLWAAAEVRSWRDEAVTAATQGDGLDRRSALDAALWRRQIAKWFLNTWRGPLGKWE